MWWWNQFFYTKSFGKFQVFAEFDMLFRFKIYEEQIGMLDLPMSAFFSYFPTNKITIYAMTQHVPRFTNDYNPDITTDWVIPSNYTASGLGFKYQINRGGVLKTQIRISKKLYDTLFNEHTINLLTSPYNNNDGMGAFNISKKQKDYLKLIFSTIQKSKPNI